MASPHVHKLSALDILTLLINVHGASSNPYIGMEDAERALRDIYRELNFTVNVPRDLLESTLWACNMNNEAGKFQHPNGMTFKEFVNKVSKGHKFNLDYNVIEAD